jgi:NitT/TauT family transport system substrate-binding protein
MRASIRQIISVGSVAAALLTAAACGGSAASGSGGSDGGTAGGASLGSVTLVTGAKNIIAADLPFVVAKEKGFYAKAGLRVDINFGDGYDTALRVVGSGQGQYAETDLASITGAVDQGLPVQSVAIYSQTSPAGLVFHSDKPINSPADVRGKKVAVSAGSGSGRVFDAWLKANSVTDKDYTRVVVPGHQKPIVFAQNKVDAYVGLGYDDLPEARKVAGDSSKVGFYYFAKNNIKVPGVAVAASKTEIKGHAQRIKAFLAATEEGYKLASTDLPTAVQLAQKLQPTTDPKLLTEQWKEFISVDQASASSNPWGTQADAAWKQTVNVFSEKPTDRSATTTPTHICRRLKETTNGDSANASATR